MLALSAILAISLTFASCANPSDSNSNNSGGNNTSLGGNSNNNNNNSNNDNNNSNSNSNGNNENNNNGDNSNNDNSSSTLPENVGKNPIRGTVKLMLEDDDRTYLELKVDGTARYFKIYNDEEETEAQFSYTYNANEKTISMKVEKYAYWGTVDIDSEAEGQLLTYDECLSKLNKDLTRAKVRQSLKEKYERYKDDERFEESFPDCNSYEEFEAEVLEKGGFDTFADYVQYVKQDSEDIYKAMFNAQTTFSYEIEDGEITLTEKFTGVKNMFIKSGCGFYSSNSISGCIYNYRAYYYENDVEYTGIPNTDKKTISFRSEGVLKFNATFTENLAKETVTINCEDKKYVCEFEGQKFIQE